MTRPGEHSMRAGLRPPPSEAEMEEMALLDRRRKIEDALLAIEALPEDLAGFTRASLQQALLLIYEDLRQLWSPTT
jgi:hypothetical protein